MECAETLRKEGFKGRVMILSRESDIPYDRPKLSKVKNNVPPGVWNLLSSQHQAMHVSALEIALRSEDFYKQNDIELKLGKEVR